MREIFFRAWNKYHQKMYPVYMLNFESDLVYCKGDDYSGHTFGKIDCEIMQFTGLTDNFGNKIFEGDIICLSNDDYHETTYHEVVYAADKIDYYPAFILRGFESESNSFSHAFCSDEYTVAVAGNIHQNHELLK